MSASATRVMTLGAGELGKEVIIELQRLGVEVIAVDRYANAPGMQVAHRSHVINMLDGDELRRVIEAEQPALVVPEIEAIATPTLVVMEAEGWHIIPTARAARLTMNREGIRRLAAETLGVATSAYRFAATEEEYRAAVDAIGTPCVVKPVMSSSGKGQTTVQSPADAMASWHEAREGARGGADKVIVEGFIDFDYEITLLTVRHRDGVTFCAPIGHRQEGGDYQESWQPQPMSNAALTECQRIAELVTGELGGSGIFGVEFFIKDDAVWFSEVSPRPHDTGMVTLISQDLSEFALHARAILGLPVPAIRQFGPAASAVILAHGDSDRVSYGNLEHALAAPDTQIRLFGKPDVHGERRMGVALALDDTVEKARNKAIAAAASVDIFLGGTKRRMSSDERLRLAQRRGQSRFLSFDERTVPETGFGTLDMSLWKPLLSAEGALEPEASLAKLALLADDESATQRATVAGILMCTPNPEQWFPNACVTAVRYRGSDRASGQVDAQEIVGPLNRQIADGMSFLTRNMRVAARKEPERVDVPQYSDKALFEAVVNAVAHRDYSIRGSRVRLSMFEDRVEIQSPGALPNNLTLESIGDRQATRNEALTSLLGRMPVGGVRGANDRRYFMERRGDGVPIIRRETLELSGRLPQYRLVDESEVLLTIPAAMHRESPAKTVVVVWSAGRPVADAEVVALFPNKTWKLAKTNDNGAATLDLWTTDLPMTVFVAAKEYAAHLVRDWTPSQRALAVELKALPGGGSRIFPEATGNIPGLEGRLNPIRDAHDRTYVYAHNIAINDGAAQPVHFVPSEELRLVDANGTKMRIRILDIAGRSALVEYRGAADNGGR